MRRGRLCTIPAPSAAMALLTAVAFVAGCDNSPDTGRDAGATPGADTATPSPAATADTAEAGAPAQPSASAQLVPITHAQWEQKLRTYAPDIVVVDFWATWCTPCIERFPKMIAMAERYRDRGVRFVSMCMEDRDDHPAVAGAERFLADKRSPLDDYLLDEPLLEGFEDFGLLSVPAVYVYDRSSALHTRLTADDPRNQFDESDVEAAIEALLSP